MAEWPFCSIGSQPAWANSRVSLQCSRRFTRVGEPSSALPCAFGGLPAQVDCRAHCNIRLVASSRAVFGGFPQPISQEIQRKFQYAIRVSNWYQIPSNYHHLASQSGNLSQSRIQAIHHHFKHSCQEIKIEHLPWVLHAPNFLFHEIPQVPFIRT